MANALVELSNAITEAVERAGRSVVAVLEGGRAGVSGTVWREGVVVTAEHTLRGMDEVTIVLPAGEKARAKITGRDATTDIAVLRVESNADAAAHAKATEAKVGQIVLAVGRRGEGGLSVSHGVISATGQPWRTFEGGRIDHWLRLDLLPYPGFSGGPLVDAEGRVLGINTSGPRRSIVTIPTETVNRVVDQLLAKGRIARGYLGLAMQPVAVPLGLQRALGMQIARGLLVVSALADGPAHKAGLAEGDLIVEVNGQPVTRLGDLQSLLDGENIGKPVKLRVLRGGNASEITVTVGERSGGE